VKRPSVSVIVPARDEAFTIPLIPKLVPRMGKWTEIIFVEGFSKDGTWGEISKLKTTNSKLRIRKFRQTRKKGKAGAVEIGFKKAKGEILMILDADLSVHPKYLKSCYKLLASGRADFANASRFFYPREKGAMKYFNHLGNRFFAFVFSLVLKQKITDTLCGTKALFRRDYRKMLPLTRKVRKIDPYSDFTLLMGASRLKLKVAEVPVRYKARVYGESKISPFWDGLKLIHILISQILSK
jgi:glycosyltransferase involved in cell wall biosynthesis